MRKKAPAGTTGGRFSLSAKRWDRSAERGDSLGQPSEFARSGIGVKHALGNAPGELRLSRRQRGARGRFVAGVQRRFDLLDEGPDAADARAIDVRAPIVAPNGELLNIWSDSGLKSASAGGDLLVDDDQLFLTANVATAAKYVEFHGYYLGYDEDNNDRDGDKTAEGIPKFTADIVRLEKFAARKLR